MNRLNTRPRNLPYTARFLTWANNGWIIASEVAQLEDTATEVLRFIEKFRVLTNRVVVNGFIPQIDYHVVGNLGVAHLKLLGAIQDRLETIKRLASHYDAINIPNFEMLEDIEVDNVEFYDLSTLFNALYDSLQQTIEQCRQYLLPKIAPPRGLLISSPFFQRAFEVHLAWQRHLLAHIDGPEVFTDRELWNALRQIVDIVNNEQGDQRIQMLEAVIYLAFIDCLPLGTDRIPFEPSYRRRIDAEESWMANPAAHETVREHGPVSFLRARIQGLQTRDDVNRFLLLGREVRIILGLRRFRLETQDDRERRRISECAFLRRFRMSPEELRAFYRRRRRQILDDPEQLILYRIRQQRYIAQARERRWADPTYRETRNMASRQWYHDHAEERRAIAVQIELDEIAEANQAHLEVLARATANCAEHRRIDNYVRMIYRQAKHRVFATAACQRVKNAAIESVYRDEFERAVANEPHRHRDELMAEVRIEYAKKAANAGWEAERAYTFAHLAATSRVPASFRAFEPPLRLHRPLLKGDVCVRLLAGGSKPVHQLTSGDVIILYGVPHTIRATPQVVLARNYATCDAVSFIEEDWLDPDWHDPELRSIEDRIIQLRKPIDWKWTMSDTPDDDPLDNFLVYMDPHLQSRVKPRRSFKKRYWGCIAILAGKHIADGLEPHPYFATGWVDYTDVDHYTEVAHAIYHHCEMDLKRESVPSCLLPVLETSKLGRRLVLCCPDKFHRRLRDEFDCESKAPVQEECTIRIFEGAHTKYLGRFVNDSVLWKIIQDGFNLPGFKNADIDSSLGEGLDALVALFLNHPCEDYPLCLLAGLIDGDGSFFGGETTIVTAYENLRDAIARLLDGCGIDYDLKHSHVTGPERIRGAICDTRDRWTFVLKTSEKLDRLKHFIGLFRKSNRPAEEFTLEVCRSETIEAFYRLPIVEENVRKVTLSNGLEMTVATFDPTP